MNRRVTVTGLRKAVPNSLWLPGVLLFAFVGCATSNPKARLQVEEETDRDRYGVKTVGDWTTVGNATGVQLAGVGLVTGLPGTGGESPADGYRTMLEDQLRKKGVRNIKELLSSPDNSLVVVTAHIPAGASVGDPIDVEVTLPPRSRATSLRGGFLQECSLFNYEFAKNISPTYPGPDHALKGNTMARASGPLLVGFGDGDEAARVRRGRIWGGGRCTAETPFLLMLNADQQFARVAAVIADRVNETFCGAFHGAGPDGSAVAKASNNIAIGLRVPPQYKLNIPRFLRVVRLIPLRESGGAVSEKADRRTYAQKLADDLLDPARTVAVALRLEALGPTSISSLRPGMDSKHPLVRFCAAEALAYLGSPSSGDVLAAAVDGQPALRAYALTALASLDEAVSRVKLKELLESSTDDETRYGAFRALRALDENDPAVRGELLNESFWLHQVANNTPPLVHISSTRRAEIVLFGEEAFLKPPFSFLAGEFTVTSAADDTRCIVTRVPLRGGPPSRKQCSLKLADVLRMFAEFGGMYPEAVELLQQAQECQTLSCRVRVDALPQAPSVFELAKAGRSGKLGGADELLRDLPGDQDLGLTPTLYELSAHTEQPAKAETPPAQ
jgi:Flagellar P-ring protein